MALSSSTAQASAQVADSSVPVLGPESPIAASLVAGSKRPVGQDSMSPPNVVPTDAIQPDAVQIVPLYARFESPAKKGLTLKERTANLNPAPKPFLLGHENRLLQAGLKQLMQPSGARPLQGKAAPSKAARGSGASPVVIVGPTGSGKTHLCRGLAELWQNEPADESDDTADHHPGNVYYLTASDFRRDLASAIDQEEVALLRQHWRSARLLVIDDLHRFAPLERLCEELRQTIDAVQAGGGIVVVASSTTMAATDLPRSLISRLTAGITLEIAPAGHAVREELLMLSGREFDCRITPEAASLIAQALPGEARHLAGIAAELRRHYGRNVARTQAEHYLKQNNRLPTPPAREIIRLVSAQYRVPQKVLQSASRKQTAVQARSVAIYLIRELTPLSYEQIGRTLGGRDHTTVMHNYRRIKRLLPKDRALQSVLADLRQSLATAYPQAASQTTANGAPAGGPTS